MPTFWSVNPAKPFAIGVNAFCLQTQVPSLVDGIRSAELLVGVYGVAGNRASLAASVLFESDNTTVDAIISDGVVSFVDNSMRELI